MATRIEFYGLGELSIDLGKGELLFIAANGDRVSFADHPLLGEVGELRWTVGAGGSAVLLGRHKSDRLHFLDARTLQQRSVSLGERLPRVEELTLHSTRDQYIALSESGIYVVDQDGSECWRVARTTYGWRFVGESEESLFFSDVMDNLLEFDAATGREV